MAKTKNRAVAAKAKPQTQIQKFQQLAKELECDPDPKKFEATLEQLAHLPHKPHKI
jgi:hypothetical protein